MSCTRCIFSRSGSILFVRIITFKFPNLIEIHPYLENRYIAAEQVPVKYGGLSKEGEFGTADAVTEITVKPATKQTLEFPVNEVGIRILLSFFLGFLFEF